MSGYTIKLLLSEIPVYMGNNCSDVKGAWKSRTSEQVFPRMDPTLG